jgi:diguanylate cyclase (GGDEF)-like protein
VTRLGSGFSETLHLLRPGPSGRGGRRMHTSTQIRPYALAWAGAAVLVLLMLSATQIATSRYSDAARSRSGDARAAQGAESTLALAVQQEAGDRLAWEVSRRAGSVPTLRQDSARTRDAVAALERIAGAHADQPLLRSAGQLAGAVGRWEADASTAFAQSRHRPPPSAPPAAFDRRAGSLEPPLAALGAKLDHDVASADHEASQRAWQADLMRLLATLLGFLVLLLGGGMLLHKAWLIARDADARREREVRWSHQIEAILEWSSRAKSATTRSQLIGFAHLAPKEAIGAACLVVAEGGPARHGSHGLPRITVPVDDSGAGLHVSVCFADGRGDELDHHTLDLMLGHLAALWRTVLRQEELERAAGHDALTGLPNRRTFEAELRRRVGLSKRRGLGFTLAIVDLDHFKLVNDSLGHPEGDAVLRRAGGAVRTVLRGSDRIYRLGGEEFALLLETVEPGGVAEVLNRAREAIKSLGVEPAPGARTSASIGWAVFPDDAGERAELVAAADTALYEAKNSGRDRVLRCGEQSAAA